MSLCLVCSAPIQHMQKKSGKYCSRKCVNESDKQKYRLMRGDRPVLPTPTTGAISELLVAADMLKRGWAVFRALSPACFCDLIAHKDGKSLRIEVRSGYRNQAGRTMYSKAPNDANRQDIFAIVLAHSEIVYEPELPDGGVGLPEPA